MPISPASFRSGAKWPRSPPAAIAGGTYRTGSQTCAKRAARMARPQWGSGPRPTTLTRPTHGELHRGHLIVNEIEAAYGGYHAQGVQPIAIQDCDPVYKDLYARHAEYWQRCFDALRVGRTVREVDEL